MSAYLPKTQVAQFWNQGFLFPIDAMSEKEAARTLVDFRQYERVVEASDSKYLINHKHFPKLHLLSLWADRLVHNEIILDAVESIIGPNILAWSTGIFTRPAGSSASLAWHQDILYFGLQHFEHAVRVWVALTPTSQANGTMRYAPGSHKHGIVNHRYQRKDPASIARGEAVCLDINEAAAVDVTLLAGQCSMHHLALAHCSGPNLTDSDRVNFTVDYISPEVEPTTQPDSALLVRGVDRFGHYLPERRPDANFSIQALEAYSRATKMRDRRICEIMNKAGSFTDEFH